MSSIAKRAGESDEVESTKKADVTFIRKDNEVKWSQIII